jgi:ABC-type dipeptide/oligopeptide/nickel transport system permease subunit
MEFSFTMIALIFMLSLGISLWHQFIIITILGIPGYIEAFVRYREAVAARNLQK